MCCVCESRHAYLQELALHPTLFKVRSASGLLHCVLSSRCSANVHCFCLPLPPGRRLRLEVCASAFGLYVGSGVTLRWQAVQHVLLSPEHPISPTSYFCVLNLIACFLPTLPIFSSTPDSNIYLVRSLERLASVALPQIIPHPIGTESLRF